MKRTFTLLVIGSALLMGGVEVGLAQNLSTAIEAQKRGDYETAILEFRYLAAKGNSLAQYNLGVAYLEGKGVAQDDQEAVKWFRMSAEHGYSEAQYNLGQMYRMGKGVLQNDHEAVKWYRLAAQNGHALAQYNLGAKYAKGQGVTQDYVYAHMWWNIAASSRASGDRISADAVKSRDDVASKMTAAQIAEAQKLAKLCVARNYKGC